MGYTAVGSLHGGQEDNLTPTAISAESFGVFCLSSRAGHLDCAVGLLSSAEAGCLFEERADQLSSATGSSILRQFGVSGKGRGRACVTLRSEAVSTCDMNKLWPFGSKSTAAPFGQEAFWPSVTQPWMGIFLDPKIRNNVLLPIFIVVVLTSMIRSSLMILLKAEPKVDVKEVKTQSMLGRCKMLRAASHFLTEKAFKSRKAYFVKKDVGVLVKSVPKAKDPMEALQGGSDPMAMMGMMKGQMVFMVSQGLLAYWVSHLFSGFLVAKTPFPLTFQFKAGSTWFKSHKIKTVPCFCPRECCREVSRSLPWSQATFHRSAGICFFA